MSILRLKNTIKNDFFSPAQNQISNDYSKVFKNSNYPEKKYKSKKELIKLLSSKYQVNLRKTKNLQLKNKNKSEIRVKNDVILSTRKVYLS